MNGNSLEREVKRLRHICLLSCLNRGQKIFKGGENGKAKDFYVGLIDGVFRF